MTEYHQAPWAWVTDEQGSRWEPPLEDCLGTLDTRSLEECAIAGGVPGEGIFAYADGTVVPGGMLLASDPDEVVSAAARTYLEARYGTTLAAVRFADILLELFLAPANVDVTGATKRKPLMPTAGRKVELHLAGLLRVVDAGPDAAIWPVIRDQYRHDFRTLRLAAEGGAMPLVAARRVLGAWMARYGVSDACEFQTPGDPTIEPLAPETTITESFNKADAATLGPDLSWTDLEFDFQVVSNAAQSGATGMGSSTSRADSDLSSADHYAQVVFLSGSAPTVMCRKDSSTTLTGYNLVMENIASSWQTRKCVANTETVIGSNTGGAAAVNDVAKIEANGTTIKRYKNGAAQDTTTDSAISTGLRGAIRAYYNGGSYTGNTRLDSFQAADLTAGPTAGVGASAGVGAATAVGTATAAAVAASTGAGVALGVGTFTLAATDGVAAAAGVGTALGVGAATAAGVANAAGIGAALGVGASIGIISAVGNAAGTSEALGYSPTLLGGGEAGRGAKGGRARRKRITWLPADYDIETGEPRPVAAAPEAPPSVKLSKGERKVARLLAQYRSRDDDMAERARAQLEALYQAQNSELAQFIARQEQLDVQRRAAAAIADGTWTATEQHSVAPTEQAPPVYIDAKSRVVIVEAAHEDPMTSGSEWLNVREVAELLGLSLSVLNKWRSQDKGPPWYTFGHAVRYSVGDIEAWLAANRCHAMPSGRRAPGNGKGGRPRTRPADAVRDTVATHSDFETVA